MATYNLFGFKISRGEQEEVKKQQIEQTFALPANDDGAVTLQTGAYFGTYVDLEGVIRNEVELITRYREMAMQPELETAIDDIVNEAIVVQDSGVPVAINLDELKQPETIKKKIAKEFDTIMELLDFANNGHEMFRRWYVDGRLFYNVMINKDKPRDGIYELRYIDPRRIRKVREIQKQKDPRTGAEIVINQQEYYIYNERGQMGGTTNMGIRIAPDSVINVNSGLMDSRRAMVLSYLHKAIKPLNLLRMVEDATVIYRLSRAPERRVFYIDVGNLPKQKADQYMKDVMTKYRNKLVYDSDTGEVKDTRKHLSILEDFWLPRREGARGTEVDTLQGAMNLGELEDVKYFERKLYRSLGVPISRLEPQQGFSLGRTTEITRDELRFTKFIQRIRNRFAQVFDDAMRIQLVLKGICTEDEWKEFRQYIWYDFKVDNNFNELKEQELIGLRVALLMQVDPFVGRYFSMEWVKKNILQFTDDEIEEILGQIEDEKEAGVVVPGMGLPGAPQAGMAFTPDGQPIDPLQQAQAEQDHAVNMASLKMTGDQMKAETSAAAGAIKPKAKKKPGMDMSKDIDTIAKKGLFKEKMNVLKNVKQLVVESDAKRKSINNLEE